MKRILLSLTVFKRKVFVALVVAFIVFNGPQLSAQTVLFSEDFSSLTSSTVLPQGNWVAVNATANNTWGITSSSCNINGNSLCVAGKSGGSYALCSHYERADQFIAYKSSGVFSTTCHSNVSISFNYKVGGDITDYGMVVYCLGAPGTFANWVPITTGGPYSNGKFYNISSVTSASINLPAGAINQPTVYIGFLWINNADVSANPGFVVDDIVVTGTSPVLPSCATGFAPTSGSTLSGHINFLGTTHIVCTF